MREYVASSRRRDEDATQEPSAEGEEPPVTSVDALKRALSLVSAAIADTDVIERSSTPEMRGFLSLSIVGFLVQLLKGNVTPRS